MMNANCVVKTARNIYNFNIPRATYREFGLSFYGLHTRSSPDLWSTEYRRPSPMRTDRSFTRGTETQTSSPYIPRNDSTLENLPMTELGIEPESS